MLKFFVFNRYPSIPFVLVVLDYVNFSFLYFIDSLCKILVV